MFASRKVKVIKMKFAQELANISDYREDKNMILKKLLEVASSDIVNTFKKQCYEFAKEKKKECTWEISCYLDRKTTNRMIFKIAPDFSHIYGIDAHYPDCSTSWYGNVDFGISMVRELCTKLYPKEKYDYRCIQNFLRDNANNLEKLIDNKLKDLGFKQYSVSIQYGIIKLKAKW